jgi:hypothetical protein
MKAMRRPPEWLSATLLTGLFVMAMASALVVYLADEVGERAWLTRFDLRAAQFFHRYGAPWTVHAVETVTFLWQRFSFGHTWIGRGACACRLAAVVSVARLVGGSRGRGRAKRGFESGGSAPPSRVAPSLGN